MFEFTGKTNHKIKVVNVTEARGNFATILSDAKSHYIITKNSKPQRVIINYDDYKRLQDLVQNEKQRQIVEPEFGVSIDEDTQNKRNKPAKSLKGMIAAQFELSKQGEETDLAPEPEPFSLDQVPGFENTKKVHERVISETADDDAMLVTETQAQPDESFENPGLKEFMTPAHETDYFSEGDVEMVELETILPEPETDVNEETNDEELEIPPLELNSEISIDEIATTRQETPPDAGVVEPQNTSRTPEEEEYFKRYRKLYESYAPPVEPVVKVQSPWPMELQKVWEANPSATPNVTKETTPTLVDVHEPSFVQASTRNWEDSIMSPPITEEERQSYQRQPNEEKSASITDDGLPSLQELLKDLEQERLSGEEAGNGLASQDIEDLINRITSD